MKNWLLAFITSSAYHVLLQILSCVKAIQLAYRMSLVLLKFLFVPEIIFLHLPPPAKVESHPITFTVLV